jgi:hypothetical protein
MTMPIANPGPGRDPMAERTRHALAWRIAAWTVALLVLAAVFAAYLDPAMAMLLAQQLWSCF